ncbi:TPA: hypothetical protein DEP96_00155 [Candidatus Uhrbacteria bacterium]|nr:hypothetical protein [Candidatus Uhrbacteria bacterium]
MQAAEIVGNWQLGEIESIKPVGKGLINATFKVQAGHGKFAMQQLHEIIPKEAVADMLTVTNYLAEQGVRVPKLLLTENGQPSALANDGSRWRVYPWLEGVVVEAVADEAMAREAGRMVGVMHGLLAKLDYRPTGSIPHFHDTPFILSELQSVMGDLPEDLKNVADDVVTTATSLLIDGNQQPKQIIHGDLKISNLLFNGEGVAVGVIDFDTILWHFPAIDLGDALRSWCNRTSEDDVTAVLDRDLCAAALVGYAEGLGRELMNGEQSLYLQATKLIALELTARFLIDVVRDNYFGYDAERYDSRQSHNRARALGQYHLARSIELI